MESIIFGGLILLVILGLIFYALRELMLWYWRIDEAVKLLTEIRDRLPAPPSALPSGKFVQVACPKCAYHFAAKEGSESSCPKCFAILKTHNGLAVEVK